MTLDSQPISQPSKTKGLIKGRLTKSLIGLIMLLGLFSAGYWADRQVKINTRQAARSKMQTVSVSRETIPITISANGTIAAKQSTNVSPKSAGRLKRLLVDEGDSVQVGQALAYMDDSDLQGQLIQAQGALAAAEANLQKVVAGNRQEDIAQAQSSVVSAQASLRQSEADLNRYEQLYRTGAVSDQSLDQYRATRDTNRAALDKAQQALKLLQIGNRQEDIAAARAQVLQQQGNLKTIQTQIQDAVIRAPFSGIVTAKYADPGDFVTPTTSGSDVSSSSSSSILSLAASYQVVANVAETDISKIKLGQPVTIRAAAYPDKTFQGKVAQIGAQATVTSNVTSVKVKVDFTDPQRLLLPSMNVDVKFDVGKLDNALVVPTVAIVRQENGTGVQVITQHGIQFTPIQTGMTLNDKTEVRSGLQENAKVLISAPPGYINSGSRTGSSRSRSSFPGGFGGPLSAPFGRP